MILTCLRKRDLLVSPSSALSCYDDDGNLTSRRSAGDCTSCRYTERLADAGIEPSVGSVGNSYDNALAETIFGLFKAEVIHRGSPWRSLEEVELATLEWVAWFNHRRLLSSIGDIPPAEFEAMYYERQKGLSTEGRLN